MLYGFDLGTEGTSPTYFTCRPPFLGRREVLRLIISVDGTAVRPAPDQVLVPGQKRAKGEADVDGDVPQHVRRQEDVAPPSAHKSLRQAGRLDAEPESEGAEGEGL